MNKIEELNRVVGLFHEAHIDFVLIGGLAMIAHGANTITMDVDFAYAVDTENTKRLAEFLASIHARVLGRPAQDSFVITAQILQRVRFLNLNTDVGEVDVMREVPGMESFFDLYKRSIEMEMGDFMVRVASLDDLIAMKRAANRPKDQSHLYELLALKKLIEQED